jgi:RNA polymerase sigma-70 factor, ECF subfamily
VTGSDRDREFGAFVGARSAALLRTAYLVTGHRQSAEDLLQTALAKTYLAWNRIDGPESVEAYVRRVMVTTHISWWRRHKGREQTADPQVEPDRTRTTGDGSPTANDAFDERDRLWNALRGLPDRQRTVLVLRYYEDLTEEEIAHLMGCSRGTVKTHASRGLAALRTRLAADDATDVGPTTLDRTGGAR